MLRGNKYRPWPIDVWGIGIILYCMVCGALPFEGEKEDILIRNVVQCNYNCPYYINSNVRALFKRILCPNPNDRITMDELKMNCIYNMGKANFIKYYKIFGENGELLPQVNRFIKEKTINYLETECSMEITDNIEDLTAYKIFFRTFMHKTQWNRYLIPKNNEQNVQQIEQACEKKTDENVNSENKSNNNNNIENTENNKEDQSNDDLLSIPPHESLSSAIAKTFEYNNEFKVNLSKEDIDAMRKLGILSHSFDANWVPKVRIQENMYNYNNGYLNINDIDNYGDYNMVNKPYNGKPQKIDIQGSAGTTGAVSQQLLNQNSKSNSNMNINYPNDKI
jgi:hypothetical protein